MPSKITLAHIVSLLGTSDRAVERGILVVYRNQTTDEQATETTVWANGQGFNARDAEIGTSFAKQILKGYRLSALQMEIARKLTLRYKRQILNAALAKEAAKENDIVLPVGPWNWSQIEKYEVCEFSLPLEIAKRDPFQAYA